MPWRESQDQMVDHCIRFAVDLLKYREDGSQPCTAPFFLGLSGIQGAGKTTLVRMTIRKYT